MSVFSLGPMMPKFPNYWDFDMFYLFCHRLQRFCTSSCCM